MSDDEREALPIQDYDHLPTGSLATRIRSLDAAGIESLLDYEGRHGNRAPVITVLSQRLAALRSGATPSPGDPDAGARPEVDAGVGRESAVTPVTSGPPINPPSHGDPTNPAQPRR